MEPNASFTSKTFFKDVEWCICGEKVEIMKLSAKVFCT